jgi:hypothetical protein
MAYTVQPGSQLLLTIVGADSESQVTVNNFHYLDTGVTTISDGAQALLDFLNTWTPPSSLWRTKFLNCIDSTWTWTYAQAQWIFPTRFVAQRLNMGVVGTVVAGALPSVCSVVCKFVTDLATKKDRGRCYMPAVPKTFQSQSTDQVTNGGITNYTNFAVQQALQLTTLVNPRTYQPVIFHRSNPSAPTPIRGGIGGAFIKTQRRRLLGHGK